MMCSQILLHLVRSSMHAIESVPCSPLAIICSSSTHRRLHMLRLFQQTVWSTPRQKGEYPTSLLVLAVNDCVLSLKQGNSMILQEQLT